MVLEAIFNLNGAIFFKRNGPLSRAKTFQSSTIYSNLRRCTLIRQEALPCVMESLLKNLALLFTSGPLLDTLRTRAVSLMRAYCCSIGWVPKKLLSLSCP